ncbi:hypothetical protein [Nonlabens sp.]|uniref:hypothetical protein n=1 Tax=Nonlabens sp. TaxID=1888209 RepID=UPI0025EF8688|nr:hypothetical protein [Nonlabens sp.]
MKKYLRFLPTVLLGFCLILNSCSTEEDSQNLLANTKSIELIEPSGDPIYFNSFFEHQGIEDVSVTQTYQTDIDFVNERNEISQIENNYNYDSSISVEINVAGDPYIFHILPLSSGKGLVHLYFEQDSIVDDNYLEISMTDNPDYIDFSWEKKEGFMKHDDECNEGADKVGKIGAAIAVAGLFGCPPCIFAGGAVAAVAGVLSLFCP